MTLKNILIVVVLVISAYCVLNGIKSDIIQLSIHRSSLPFIDWFTPALICVIFTALGIIKIIGQKRGLVGGGGKPWKERLMSGYCPTWSRPVNLAAPYVFLGMGIFHFGIMMWLLFDH
jgi:hypothetical protein